MTKSPLIAASILSADFANLGDSITEVDNAGCDWIHVDVMDGHYVPNLTIGAPIIKAIRKYSQKPFDVHLMIKPVAPLLDDFIAAGADRITFHPDSENNPTEILKQLKSQNISAGLALSPKKSLDGIAELIEYIDLLLIMTVEPGFGGQSFMNTMLPKITQAKQLIENTPQQIHLQVDGGITPETAQLAVKAGANVLVAGSAVFNGGKTQYQNNINNLKIQK